MQPLKVAQSDSVIALDANAGFPLSHGVITDFPQWLALAEPGVNASSLHSHGKQVRARVRTAQNAVAQVLGFSHGILEWLSSGSRANARAAEGLRTLSGKFGLRGQNAHDSVARIPGIQLIRPNPSPEVLEQAGWVSLIWVHNETGQILPIAELVAEFRAKAPRLLIHIDAVQAWGRVDLTPVFALADAVSFSGSKVGALPGVGLLWISGKLQDAWAKQVSPLQNEASWLSMVSLGRASADLAEFTRQLPRIAEQRVRIEKFLKEALGDRIEIVAESAERAATTSLFLFHGVRERAVADALDLEGIRVGTGAACRSGTAEASPTLLAMGYPSSLAKTATRLSWSRPLSEETLMHVASRVQCVAQRAMGL